MSTGRSHYSHKQLSLPYLWKHQEGRYIYYYSISDIKITRECSGRPDNESSISIYENILVLRLTLSKFLKDERGNSRSLFSMTASLIHTFPRHIKPIHSIWKPLGHRTIFLDFSKIRDSSNPKTPKSWSHWKKKSKKTSQLLLMSEQVDNLKKPSK